MNSTLKKKKFFELSGQSVDILSKIAVFLLALFLTSVRFIFGTYPFGFVLLAGTKKHTPFAFVGAIASVLFFLNANIVYLIAFVALLALRIAGSAWLGESKTKKSLGKETKNTIFDSFFCENVTVRVALSSLCVFIIGVFDVIANNYNYYYIFVLVFTTVFVGIFTYALSGLFSNSRDTSFYVGVCSLAFMVIFSLAKKEIFGLDLSIILTYSIVLYVSKMMGGGAGAGVGALLGLCHGYEFAPCFAILALVSSLFWNFSYYFGIMCASILSVGYAIFISGYEAIVYLLPEAIFSALIMYSLLRFEVLPRIQTKKEEASTYDIEVLTLNEKEKIIKNNLETLASSFREIAEISKGSSAMSKRLSLEECRSLCLEITEEHCFSCPKKSICWEKDIRATEDNLSALADGVFSKNEVTNKEVSEKFLHRCPNIDKIVFELNENKRSRLENNVRSDKIEVCAQNYDVMSKMLVGVAEKDIFESEKNTTLTEKAERAVKKIGLKFEKIEIIGKRDKKIIITGVDTEKSKCSDEELKESLEKVLACNLSLPIFEVYGTLAVIKLESVSKYEVVEKIGSLSLDKNMPNGDTCATFYGENNKFYALICDGMGSGENASITSSLCVDFLKKILISSPKIDLALSMLNTFIRAKNIECSSSVDLMEIDLLNGECNFIKSGACASFVKRGENVFRLNSKTAPIGIMKNPDAEKLSLSLQPNDTIIMISDGIATDEKEYASLTEIISTCQGENDTLVNKILSFANAKDDKTVIVTTIKKIS